MRFERALASFRAVYVAYIVYASGKTLLHAIDAGQDAGHAQIFIIALASLEILAALAFFVVRFERVACGALLAIFAVAAVLTVAEGTVPAHLIFYAATALFIVEAGKQVRAQSA